jgi:hypothetical protein
MEWKSANKNDQGLISIPKRWLHIHYYEAMNILFRFENSLRVFVYTVLKNEFLDKWQECNFSFPGADANSINSIARKRIGQAESFGYLGFDIKAPLMHLTSGELVELITSAAYWPKFQGYFRGNKEIMKNKLLEIGSIRNSLAHFRPIKSDDIELVKQNSRHTLIGVEECLQNIFLQASRVPTNTTDDWYKSISTLGNDQITTVPYFSKDESWINIRLKFIVPTLWRNDIIAERYYSFSVATINSPNILRSHVPLTKFVTYLTETVASPTFDEDKKLTVSKELNFVFRKDILAENYTAIAEEFKSVLRKVSEECDLLCKDNLARGSIIETASLSAWWQKPEGQDGSWSFSYQDLLEEYRSDDPDEYWGQRQYTSDVVAGFRRYPWMPADISQMEDFWE